MTNGVTSKHIDEFYINTLRDLIAKNMLTLDGSTLVVCGGNLDYRILQTLGFSNVTISNVDARLKAETYAPYTWSFQDVEALGFHDGQFDQVIVHNGLHHCASPHRGLTEMYRVAARSMVVIEPRDSLAVRLACRLNLSTHYEVDAVIDNSRRFGGVRNTALPNYVYRWVERDVEKTIATFDPTGPVNVRYFHGVALPRLPDRDLNNRMKLTIAQLLRIPGWIIKTLLPKQGNRFAFYVGKPIVRHPWLKEDCNEIKDCWPA